MASALTVALATALIVTGDPSAYAANFNRSMMPEGSHSSVHQPLSKVGHEAAVRNWKVPRLAVMPLGDSITYGTGSSTESSYRAELWNQLTPHTDSLHFVGSQRSGKLPDPDHEGHYGWKIGGLTGNIENWLVAAKPNVVLLHIGTNDMHDNYRVDQAPDRLGELIDMITAAAPDMTVLVSSLVPSGDPETEKRVEKFNAAVPRLVEERQGRGFHVGYVDMNKVTTRDLRDVLHPNDSGYSKMAEAFYGGIARATGDGWIQERVDIKPVPPRKIPVGDYRVDINGDGKADYLVVHDDGSVGAWVNSGGSGHGGWAEFGTFATGVGESGSRVRFADINGDGKADYLVVHDDGSVGAWVNSGGSGHGGWAEFGTFATGVGESGSRVRFADINGDGKADYLVVHDDGSVGAWVNSGGSGHGGWAEFGTFATGVGESGSRVRFADINGDGKADYLVVQDNGAIDAWRNDGGTGHGGWAEYGTIATGVGEPGSRVRI